MDTRELVATELGRLLNLDMFPPHRICGEPASLRREVTSVIRAYRVDDLRAIDPGTLVVFDRAQLRAEGPETDLALRLARSRELAAVVVEEPAGALPMATELLAERFGVALVLVADLDAARLVSSLDPVVRTPELVGGRLVRDFIQRLRSAMGEPDALVQLISRVTGCAAALVDSEGRTLTGDSSLVAGLEQVISPIIGRTHPTSDSISTPGRIVLLQPALAASSGPSTFWMVAGSHTDSAATRQTLEQILAVAALAFSAYFARQSMITERENRERALLLTEILDSSPSPSRRTVERAAAFGWQLSGWHTAIHLSMTANAAAELAAPQLVSAIEGALKSRDIPATLIEKPDGWVCWLTDELEPTPAEILEMSRTVRRALLESARRAPDAKLRVGIGRPHSGVEGITESLAEARQACLLAQTSDTAVSIEHIDALNVKALMTRWYTSTAVRETASHLLAPLLEADPSGELVRTLRSFLDSESSATTTAAVLGIHRNTVVQRLARIRRVLPLDLDRPDDRLVAHLATRGADVQWDSAAQAN